MNKLYHQISGISLIAWVGCFAMEEEVREDEIIEGVRYTRTPENQPLLQEEESESVNLIKSNDGVKTAEVYTVEDAVNYMGFGPFQIAVTVFAGMIWVSLPASMTFHSL